jgi:surfeit locus 1 family protein
VSSNPDTPTKLGRRLLLLGLCLMLTLACVGLGIWQLRRLATRRGANRAALLARNLPPLLVEHGPVLGLLADRRALLVGELDETREFLLRGRVVQGVPAILVVTPLRIPGTDSAILANRGYVPAADAVDPGTATWAEPGQKKLRGILLPIPDRGDGQPIAYRGRETWKSLDLAAMRARLPYPIASIYLLQEPDSGVEHTVRGTVYPFRAEAPPLDEGPHLMYAIQWFGIAAAVAAFGWIFVWAGGGSSPRGERSTARVTRP